MSSRPPSTSTTSTTSVRRNLFHHHLSRRPTTTSSSSTVSTTMADAEYPAPSQASHSSYTSYSSHTHPSIHANHTANTSRAPRGHPLDENEEIIVKVNGKYDIQTLELPPQEEGEEGGALGEGMEEVEGERERESFYYGASGGAGGEEARAGRQGG